MILYRVMDEVFRSWSHVAVLRTLIDRNNGCTGNETARLSGMHPRSAIRALGSLEELGVVNRQRGGRDHLFSLNRDHVLVKDLLMPLYKTESLFPLAIKKEIGSILKKNVISAVIFGSVARREENPRSDLDLCCIVNSVPDKMLIRELLNKKSKSMSTKYGIKIAPVFFTASEFKKKKQVRLIKEIITQGVLIVGKNLRTLLDG